MKREQLRIINAYVDLKNSLFFTKGVLYRFEPFNYIKSCVISYLKN